MTAVLDPVGNAADRATIADTLQQFKKDTTYLDAHRTEWMEKYPDHWVVVFAEELVGFSPTLEDALGIAESKGAPRSRLAFEHLSSEPEDLILRSAICR